MAVFLQRRAAAGGVEDDRVEAEAVKGVHIPPSKRACRLAIASVHLERATAALLGRRVHHAAVLAEHAERGRIGVAEKLGHDAALDESDAIAHRPLGRGAMGRAFADHTTLSWPEHRLHAAQA